MAPLSMENKMDLDIFLDILSIKSSRFAHDLEVRRIFC
jgi:Ca2+-binding EF-hand superfamily protein